MNKTSRNDLCPCGSGLKYKKCCLNRTSSPSKIGHFRLSALLIASIIVITGSVGYSFISKNASTPSSISTSPTIHVQDSSSVKSALPENLLLSKEEIKKYDVATLNLIAAQGLPNAENIEISEVQSTLKEWAKMVDTETKKYIHRFYQNPREYNNSEAYFRALMLITVLEQDLHIRYNPDLMSKPVYEDMQSADFFRNPNDLFISGLIKNRLGTCASLPVLTVAVGRQLGYPLKLVPTRAHLFVRWDDGVEKFNIESGGNGMKNYPDGHYLKWPFPIPENEANNGYYLKSMTPVQEYAMFLEMRGFCLLANNKPNEAFNAFTHVSQLDPDHPHIKMYLQKLVQMEMSRANQ